MFKKIFSFEGRIRRSEYGISLIISSICLIIINTLILEIDENLIVILIPLFTLVIIFQFTQGSKRCHDLGKNGWWQLIPFYSFWLLFQNGEHGRNQYGDNPKGIGNSQEIYNISDNKDSKNSKQFSTNNSQPIEKDNKSEYFISVFRSFESGNKDLQFYRIKQSKGFTDIDSLSFNTGTINMFPDTKMYSIRKAIVDGQNVITYSIFTSLTEDDQKESISYIGSSIIFVNKIAEEFITVNCLNELHNNTLKYNTLKNIKDEGYQDLSITAPKHFDKISPFLKSIEPLNYNEALNQTLVYCKISPDKLQTLFELAIVLLNTYDTIYFTDSHKIAEFIHYKNISQVIDKNKFENMYNKIATQILN